MKPKVILAKTAGYCFGVKRALVLADKLPRPAVTWGPLIHNQAVINFLKQEKKIDIANKVKQLNKKNVLIRTHGISEKNFQKIKIKVLNIFDGTCPFVHKVHTLVQSLKKQQYQVVVLGDKRHPEIKAILEDWPQVKVIKNQAEAKKIKLSSKQKVGLVCQTTTPQKILQAVVKILKSKKPDLKVCNTICQATIDHQKEAELLAQKVDLMIVIGGKESNNTKMLTSICKPFCPTYQIEQAAEIQKKWYTKAQKIGVTAGASTPDWIIKEVISTLKK